MSKQSELPDDLEEEPVSELPDDLEGESDEDMGLESVEPAAPMFDSEGFQVAYGPGLPAPGEPRETFRDPDAQPQAPTTPPPGPWKPPPEGNFLQRFGKWVEDKGRAAAAGTLSYALPNFADELAGHFGAQRTIADAVKAGPSVPIPQWKDAYEARRNEYRRAEENLREAEPELFHGAGLAASLLTPGPNLGRGAWGAAKSGGLMGTIGGLGGSEADLVSPTAASAFNAALDTGTGGVFGGALGAAGQQAFQRGGEFFKWAAEKSQPWLEETAATRALKAAGYIAKDLKALNKRDMDLALEQGKTLLDEPGLITPGANVSTIRDRLATLKDDYGEQIGRFLEDADQTGRKFDIEPFLQRVEAEVIGPVADDPVVRSGVNEIRRIIDGYRQRAQNMGGLSFREANAMKTRMQDHMVNWGNAWNENSPGAHSDVFAKQTQNLFLNSIDDQLGGVLGKGAQDDFKGVKNLYGTFKEALQKANERDAAMRGNNAIGMKDYLAGVSALGASMATDSPYPALAAAGATVANRVATERGSSAAAVAAKNVAQSDILRDLIQSNPDALGEWGAQLAEAAARGPGALELQDWMLAQTTPDYAEARRRAMAGATGESTP